MQLNKGANVKRIVSCLIGFLLLAAAPALAGPFLVCDPPPVEQEVAQYEIFQDGVSLGVVDAQADGSLRYDLVGVAPGAYNWTAKAMNVWGASELSDPYLSPSPAGRPANLGLSP